MSWLFLRVHSEPQQAAVLAQLAAEYRIERQVKRLAQALAG